MNDELYKSAKEGRVDFLDAICISRYHDTPMATEQNNNIVHIAARNGHPLFVDAALRRWPHLYRRPNSAGDTPLHVAASRGHLEVVKSLVTHHKSCVGPAPPWGLRNGEGTTPLHEALRNGHGELSLYLLEQDGEMASSVNGFGESLLYLAAESCCEKVVKRILDSESRWPFSLQGPHGQNPLHAAKYCSENTIRLLVAARPEQTRQPDDFGKTPLHHAVEALLHDLTRLLLELDNSAAYIPDANGLTPLLIASSLGSFIDCQNILHFCPQAIEARDNAGQTALHMFQTRTSASGDKKFLKISEIREIMNDRDKEGNTALILAIAKAEFSKAHLLLLNTDIDVGAINKQGLTALDICESETSSTDWKTSHAKRYLCVDLKVAKGRRGRHPQMLKNLQPEHLQLDKDTKNLASTLCIVAILLTTLTFAAAFTMPGGYTSNSSNSGTAVLINKVALKVFVLADTFAMCCSILVVFLVIWAMCGELQQARLLVSMSIGYLYFALYGTLVAFMAGLYAVTASDSLWVAVLVCVMASCTMVAASRNFAMKLANSRLNSREPRMVDRMFYTFRSTERRNLSGSVFHPYNA